MSPREFERLMTKATKQRDERIRQAEEEYAACKRVLEWAVRGGESSRAVRLSAKASQNGRRVRRGDMERIVAEIVDRLHGDFTVHEIETELSKDKDRKDFARSSVSSALKRLAGPEGKLEIVQNGRPRNPAIYRLSSGSTQKATPEAT